MRLQFDANGFQVDNFLHNSFGLGYKFMPLNFDSLKMQNLRLKTIDKHHLQLDIAAFPVCACINHQSCVIAFGCLVLCCLNRNVTMKNLLNYMWLAINCYCITDVWSCNWSHILHCFHSFDQKCKFPFEQLATIVSLLMCRIENLGVHLSRGVNSMITLFLRYIRFTFDLTKNTFFMHTTNDMKRNEII